MMKRGNRIGLWLALWLAMLASALPAAAEDENWVSLGVTRVGLGIDRDSIDLLGSPKVDGLRFVVSHQGVRVLRMTIVYEDGSTYEVPAERLASASFGEREIELPPFGRGIDRIDLVQRRLVLFPSTQPSVEIYGRIQDVGRRLPPDFGPGWALLGTSSVDMGLDRDVIELDHGDGPFAAIGLSVSGRDIDLRSLRVVYGNGETEALEVRALLRDGQRTRPLDLTGYRRFIRRIELVYSSDRRRGPRAEVAVFGRKAPPRPPAPAPDFGRGWELLGSRSVDMGLDRDVIEVRRGEGPYSAIGLAVRGREVEVLSVRVVYGNGRSEELRIRTLIGDGERTRPLDLAGDVRGIRRIELVYTSDRRRSAPPEVFVFGRIAEVAPPPPPPAPDFGRGWQLLGSRSVDMGLDRDVIEVGRGEGPFSAIGLTVSGREVEILSLRVIYGNGRSEELRVRALIGDGERSRPIDLTGNARGIRRIELIYSSDRRRGPRAAVAVWGKPGVIGVEPEPGGIVIPRSADFGKGWDLLGERSVDMGLDRDVIEVGIAEGPFTALGLSVLNRDIQVLQARVIYGNGQSDTLNVRTLIPEGERTQAYDLRGDRRAISRVELVYVAERKRGPRAEVLLWGKLAPTAKRLEAAPRVKRKFQRSPDAGR